MRSIFFETPSMEKMIVGASSDLATASLKPVNTLQQDLSTLSSRECLRDFDRRNSHDPRPEFSHVPFRKIRSHSLCESYAPGV